MGRFTSRMLTEEELRMKYCGHIYEQMEKENRQCVINILLCDLLTCLKVLCFIAGVVCTIMLAYKILSSSTNTYGQNNLNMNVATISNATPNNAHYIRESKNNTNTVPKDDSITTDDITIVEPLIIEDLPESESGTVIVLTPPEPSVKENVLDLRDNIEMINNELEFTEGVVVVNNSRLNIRDASNLSSNIIGKLNRGDKVTILEQDNEWYRINQGWVHSKYIKDANNTEIKSTSIKTYSSFDGPAPSEGVDYIDAETYLSQNGVSEIPLGDFYITNYCSCESCSGPWGDNTATGVTAKANHTIAVDKRVIPLGSKVRIGNVIYTAEDTGGGVRGNHIDIYRNSHSETRSHFTGHAQAYLIIE